MIINQIHNYAKAFGRTACSAGHSFQLSKLSVGHYTPTTSRSVRSIKSSFMVIIFIVRRTRAQPANRRADICKVVPFFRSPCLLLFCSVLVILLLCSPVYVWPPQWTVCYVCIVSPFRSQNIKIERLPGLNVNTNSPIRQGRSLPYSLFLPSLAFCTLEPVVGRHFIESSRKCGFQTYRHWIFPGTPSVRDLW